MTMTLSSTPTLDPNNLPGSYEDRHAQAMRYFRRGELDQAAAICARQIERISRLPERRRAPDSPLDRSLLAASILLAELHAKQGDWPALDDLCVRAQTTHPVYARRWEIEPFMLRIQYAQPEEGIRGLLALAQSQPDSFYFWRMLAQAALDVDDIDLAMTASDHADRVVTPDEDAHDMASHHIVRFQLYRRRGKWHKAAHAWNSACVLDDEMDKLREVVVRMLLDAGLYDDALGYLDDKSLTVTAANYYRAWIANQRGDQMRARYLWRKIVETDPNDDDLDGPVVRALTHCWLGQPDAALAIMLEELAHGGPLNTAEALALALAWAMHGDATAARANVKLAIERQPSTARPSELIASLDWLDFEYLVADEAIKAELHPFFETPRRPAP